MSAITILLDQWIDDSRREVAALEIHPDGRAEEMHEAVARGDTEEFKNLVRIVRDKAADELHWEEEKRRSSQDPHYQPTYFREAVS
jgi:hypothetical protein